MNWASFIFGSVALIIQQFADQDKLLDLAKTVAELNNDLSIPRIATYDFIIVGGGTSGSLLAGRLSEKYTVLVLEEGGNPPPATQNMFMNPHVSEHPGINNLFVTVPQFNFSQEYGAANGLTRHTGRMLGGSGSHNGNTYNRGNPRDYDNWADLVQDQSWAYNNTLHDFKRFENFIGDLISDDFDEYYGNTGLLTVDTDMTPFFTTAWAAAGVELGYTVADPNGRQRESFCPLTKSTKNGERESTYTAYLKPFETTRANLTVLKYSTVQEVLFHSNLTAYGVAYMRHGIPQLAHARNEVILSAGAFSSPLLLMKSGIGPRAVLEEAGIEVKVDLPGVGQNLRDHCATILGPFEVTTDLIERVGSAQIEEELNKYLQPVKSGYLTRMDVGPQAFFVSERAKSRGQNDWPDYQIMTEQKHLVSDTAPKHIFLQIVFNRPDSYGSLTLNTSNYRGGERADTKLAVIDLNLFTDSTDVEVMIEAMTKALQIMENTTAFRNMNTVYLENSPAACSTFVPRSVEYWKCYITQRAFSWNHISGTTKMGLITDPMAVVDSRLRVRGVTKLKVVDASIMPRNVNANMNAACMLISERAAQEIFSAYP